MIIKSMASKKEELEELSSLLKEKLTLRQRFDIERELRTYTPWRGSILLRSS
jgi:hypothetical protein